MTDTNPSAGQHVLVLAFNAPTRDIRVLKQIGSLSRAGYNVSTFAPIGVKDTDPADVDFALDQYWIGSAQHKLQARELHSLMQSPCGKALFAGAVDDLLARTAEQGEMQRDLMRRVFRLGRLVAMLHWSVQVRRTQVESLRNLRKWFADAQLRDGDGPNRVLIAARYGEQVLRFCDSDPQWQARLKAVGPPRIVHAHDLSTLAAGAVLADRYGAKLIYDAHEYEPENTPRLPADERKVIELIEDRALSGAAGLITVSDNIAKLYGRRHPDLDLALVYNCPDHRLTDRTVQQLRPRLGLGPDVPLMVFVGLPTLEERGLGVVLEAMTHLPDLHLAVIGPRWAKQDAELAGAVQGAGLEARVHLMEPVAPTDVITAIGDADVSVCLFRETSLNQRFAMPNKLFESLLAGVPLLVSDLPDMAALVQRMQAGLAVDQADPEAIVEAIRTLLQRRADFVPTDAARDALEQNCSWEGQEQTLLALYDRLLADPAGSDSTAS